MTDREISRAELEESLREFADDASKDLKRAKTIGAGGLAAISAAAVAAAYTFGKRRGEQPDETYVEVQRFS